MSPVSARTKGASAPIFEKFNVEQLALLTGYSEAYLHDLRLGRQPLRPRFRLTVSRILGQSEELLFGTAASEVPA